MNIHHVTYLISAHTQIIVYPLIVIHLILLYNVRLFNNPPVVERGTNT